MFFSFMLKYIVLKTLVFPQSGYWQSELLAVFCHGASGDGIAELCQLLGKGVVAKRLLLVLLADKVLKGKLYLSGGQLLSVACGVAV